MKRPFQRVDVRKGKMTAHYCGQDILINATPQLQFLQHIEWWNRSEDSFCIHVSDYNHHKVRRLKNISPLRWINGHGLKLYPGFGSGSITIGEFVFNVTYSWGGRSKPRGGWADRTSYTVQLRGSNMWHRFLTLTNQINKHEGKSSGAISITEIETDCL